jgi:hypothetical protein
MDLGDWVAGLSDLAAVDVCQQLVAAALRGPGASLEAAVDAVPPELAENPDFRELWDKFDDVSTMKLPPNVSIRLAREMLSSAAADPALSPTLEEVSRDYRDTKQFVLEVLAVGAAFSMVIFSATVTNESGKWVKKELSPAQAKAIAGWFSELKPWGLSRG